MGTRKPACVHTRSHKFSCALCVHAQVANLLGEEIPQIYALTGRGPRSALAVLRPGLAVTELAASPLPGNPTAVFTVKHAVGDEFDAYIIVSFTNATLVRFVCVF